MKDFDSICYLGFLGLIIIWHLFIYCSLTIGEKAVKVRYRKEPNKTKLMNYFVRQREFER